MSFARVPTHRSRDVVQKCQYVCKECRRSFRTVAVLSRQQSRGTRGNPRFETGDGLSQEARLLFPSLSSSRKPLNKLSRVEFDDLRKDALTELGTSASIFDCKRNQGQAAPFKRVQLPNVNTWSGSRSQDETRPSPERESVIADLRKWQTDLEVVEQENKARAFRNVLDNNTNLLQRHLSQKYDAYLIQSKSQDRSDTTKLLEDFSVEPEAHQVASLIPPAPGDLMEHSDGKTTYTGVIVRMFTDECLIYRQEGYLMNVAMRRVDRTYRVPGFESEEVIEPILPYLPSVDRQQASGFLELDNYVPAELGRALRNRLDKFLKEVEVLGHKYRPEFETIYHRVSDAEIPNEFTLKGFMDKLKIKQEDRTEAFKLALHRFLDSASNHFAALMPKGSGIYWVYTRNEAALRDRVVGWIREHQVYKVYLSLLGKGFKDVPKAMSDGANKIQSFINKARVTLEAYREQSLATMEVGTDQVESMRDPSTMLPQVKFQEFESGLIGKSGNADPNVDIIRLLYFYGVKEMFDNDLALNSCARTLLAEMNSYDELDLNRNVLKEFLGHIGLYEYHTNLHPLRFTFQHKSGALARHYKVPSLPIPFRLGEDVLKDVRTEWTGPVPYCIDPAMEAARDDGISFAKNEDGTKWIHVHIGNPAAFIPLCSPVADYSRKTQATAFLPETTLEMMDRESTMNQLSLQNARPVLTHSIKLSDEGTILDFKMGAHTIRETRLMTYAELDAQLASKATTYDQSEIDVHLGGNITGNVHSQYKLSKKDISELREFKNLIQKWRTNNMGSVNALMSQSVERGAPLEVAMRSPEDTSDTVDRPQNVRIAAKTDMRYDSMDLVASCMQMACIYTGKWAADRDLPFIYRGTAQRPDLLTLNEYLSQVQDEPGFDKAAFAQRMVNDRIFRIFARAKTSATPLHHSMLETASYARVTSPLRRFTDWLNQAQIQTALLWEAQHGKSLIDIPPNKRGKTSWLTQEAMEEESQYSMSVTAAAGSVTLRTYHHWLAVKYMEDILHKRLDPSTWRCKVELQPDQDQSTKQLLGVDREPKAYGVLRDGFRTPVYVCLTRKENNSDGSVTRKKVSVKGGETRECKIKKVWVRWGALEVELTN